MFFNDSNLLKKKYLHVVFAKQSIGSRLIFKSPPKYRRTQSERLYTNRVPKSKNFRTARSLFWIFIRYKMAAPQRKFWITRCVNNMHRVLHNNNILYGAADDAANRVIPRRWWNYIQFAEGSRCLHLRTISALMNIIIIIIIGRRRPDGQSLPRP